MRVALIFAQEQLAEGTGLRAHSPVCGTSVIGHQLELVLGFGCERVICFAPALDAAIIRLQHRCESAGARFHLLSGARQLAGCISATDDVLALADGLLVSGGAVPNPYAGSPGVLVQPVEQGVEAGFERLDLNHAAAGLLRVTGNHVARLAELPDDCDVFAALQRLALQGGVPQLPLANLKPDSGVWVLLQAERQLAGIEKQWVALRLGDQQPAAPALWLARQVAKGFGPAILTHPMGAIPLAAGAGVLLVLAVVAGWLGWPVVGLGLAAGSWLLGRITGMVARLGLRTGNADRYLGPFDLAVDAGLVLLVAAMLNIADWHDGLARIGPVVVLILVLRLVSCIAPVQWAAWLRDRMLLCAVLACAAMLGMVQAALSIGAIAILLLGFIILREKQG